MHLRAANISDLEHFYRHQADDDAIQMAAFTSEDPYDKDAYLTKWSRLLDDETINLQTLIVDQEIIGCVAKYLMEGKAEITYAIDKKYWGQGWATKAVLEFLTIEKTRPMFAHVAFDNLGSQKVLEKAGFKKTHSMKGFANARGKEIEEFVYELN